VPHEETPTLPRCSRHEPDLSPRRGLATTRGMNDSTKNDSWNRVVPSSPRLVERDFREGFVRRSFDRRTAAVAGREAPLPLPWVAMHLTRNGRGTSKRGRRVECRVRIGTPDGSTAWILFDAARGRSKARIPEDSRSQAPTKNRLVTRWQALEGFGDRLDRDRRVGIDGRDPFGESLVATGPPISTQDAVELESELHDTPPRGPIPPSKVGLVTSTLFAWSSVKVCRHGRAEESAFFVDRLEHQG
jgi:hypothetical protein